MPLDAFRSQLDSCGLGISHVLVVNQDVANFIHWGRKPFGPKGLPGFSPVTVDHCSWSTPSQTGSTRQDHASHLECYLHLGHSEGLCMHSHICIIM